MAILYIKVFLLVISLLTKFYIFNKDLSIIAKHILAQLKVLQLQAAPVAQWDKCWPHNPGPLGSFLTGDTKIQFHCTAHSLSLPSSYCSDMTEILLKRMYYLKSSSNI